ncbi:MAG: outer membrane protein assembly factor BamD [Candidatus Eisenbacteria bacterium]|nr:outer membrane protein assembly factor BamD [Candidatus Eisenbacteria bacterium]
MCELPSPRAGRGRGVVRWTASLLLLVCLGCAGAPRVPPVTEAQGAFERARRAYEQADYVRAIELLEGFGRSHPGSQYVDDALYLLGKAHQGNGEQLLARQDFERLLRDFPRSSYAEDAAFEIANSWYLAVRGPSLDAEPAEEALIGFRSYLRRYPDGKRRAEAQEGIREVLGVLAEKDFLNGRTYLRLGRPDAARRYFEKSLELWPDSPVSARAMAGIARTYEKQARPAEAEEAYRRLISHLGSDPSRYEKGAALLRRAREALDLEPREEEEEG